MGASLIATQLSMNELVGAVLVGASIILSTHSLSRMVFLRRSGSKYHLFPIINIAQFINEFCVFFLITTAFDTISFDTALWLNVINNVCYFITKPITMYLAYLRCSAVFPAFKKLDWLHYFLIGFRAVELFVIVIINIIQNYLCNGSVAAGTRCAPLAVAWTFRDAGAPVFRGYYILCEGIFYVKLFRTLKGMSGGSKNQQLKQYRQLQTSLFTFDLVLLIFMSIYRIIGIFDKSLPTYVYIELFSSTLTIFTLTEFGLNIRILFNTVADAKTESEATSSPSKLEMASILPATGGHHSGSGGGHGTHMTASATLGSAALSRKSFEQNATGHHGNRPRPLTQNSTSPLTSHAAETGYNSDYDLTGSGAVSTHTTNTAPGLSSPSNRPTSPALQNQQRPSLQLQYQQQQQLQLQQQQLQHNQRVVDDFQDYIPYGPGSGLTPISHHTSQDWLRSQPSNSVGVATTATSTFLRGHQSPSSVGGSR
ncbi:hypothetical protein BGX24_005125, partial [Mortierella sp. AD032]